MSIDELLALDDVIVEVVTIPQWNNVQIRVQSMSAVSRAEIEKRWAKRDAMTDPAGFRADVLTQSLVNDDGSPLGTPEQIRKLMGKNAAAIERLFEAACRVSAFTPKDVEELEKN